MNRKGTPENLKPFPPGQSGNPNGRPKGARTGIRARLLQLLEKEPSADIIQAVQRLAVKANPEAGKVNLPKASISHIIAEMLVIRALMNSRWSIEQILKQTENPLKQTMEVEGALGLGTFAEFVKFVSSRSKDESRTS